MIEFHVIRNRSQLNDLTDRLAEKRLPLKVAVQPIDQVRSLDANAYLWGIVYEMISEATGQEAEEVHGAYKRRFRFRHDFVYNKKLDRYEFVLASQSTANAGDSDLWDYIMRVRADAEIELHIQIPMPNEVFNNELKLDL